MKVVWTSQALSRLREIREYIAKDSPVRADAVVLRILERAESVGRTPLIGSRIDWPSDDHLREVLDRPYRIIYRVGENRVEILTVKHYRQRLVDRPTDL